MKRRGHPTGPGDADRKLGPALTVASTETSRSSGFPRLERAGVLLVLAWVEPTEPFRLRAATLPATAVR